MSKYNHIVTRLVQQVRRNWKILVGDQWMTVVSSRTGVDVFHRVLVVTDGKEEQSIRRFVGEKVAVIIPDTEEQRKYSQIDASGLTTAVRYSRMTPRQGEVPVFIRMSSGSGVSDQWHLRRVIGIVPGGFIYKAEYAILKDTGLDLPELTDADWDVDKHSIGQDPGRWRPLLGIYLIAGSPS